VRKTHANIKRKKCLWADLKYITDWKKEEQKIQMKEDT
jgi:hypothetical protein